MIMSQVAQQVQVLGKLNSEFEQILTPEALNFVADLHTQFNATREKLLSNRVARQKDIDAGKYPDFLSDTAPVRDGKWQVAETPADLMDRRVEITGPCEKKMMINAFNSGANAFMADLEDSLSPTWQNVIEGQINLKEAVRKTLSFDSPEGKSYRLKEKIATMLVRPRGWHLVESHVTVSGAPISASLFDFGLFFFHNADELVKRGSGPYFYLPKMESHLEARLWNDVFNYAQDKLKVARGTVRATVLIETILAAFEMEEILFELKEHASGLNAGRWDYIFSTIKKFSRHKEFLMPDRAQITMRVPFMRAYCRLLVKTCHRRGAHAMGGMAAFIPSRKDAAINEMALTKVREDKDLEVSSGFDGTWVAHPDLVPIAKDVFDTALGSNPNQKTKQLDDVVAAKEILAVQIEGGQITEKGLTNNVDVGLQYIESWLRGTGAAAIHNLMEDAATAEISRAQIWQWIICGAKLDDGRPVSKELYRLIREAQVKILSTNPGNRYKEAAEILDRLVESETFAEFLTTDAYKYLDK
jgi:malate synthase